MAGNEFPIDARRFHYNTALSVGSIDDADIVLFQSLINDHLKTSPTVLTQDIVPHISEHLMNVVPALFVDPRAADALDRIATVVEQAKAAERATLEIDSAPSQQPSVGGSAEREMVGREVDESVEPPAAFPYAGAATGVAVYLALIVIAGEHFAASCGDVHPEPGQSAAVGCHPQDIF